MCSFQRGVTSPRASHHPPPASAAGMEPTSMPTSLGGCSLRSLPQKAALTLEQNRQNGWEIIAPGIRALCHPPGRWWPRRGSGPGCAWPRGSLLTLGQGRELCPLGLSAEPAHPTIRVSPLPGHRCYTPRTAEGPETRGIPSLHPQALPPRRAPAHPRQLPPPPAATGSSIPSRLRGPSRWVVTRGLVPLPPRQGSAAWRPPARGAAEPPLHGRLGDPGPLFNAML